MKNKKSLIAIVALVLVVLVGVTIAYFTSSASFENIFNTGTYKVVTTEVFESPDNWAPGQEIPKTITTTNEGTIPAAVRVSYTEQWLDSEDVDITDQVDNGTAIINLDNTSDWTKEGNYYYYNYILEPDQTTTSFIRSVTLNPELGEDLTCTTSQDGLTKTCEATNPALGAKYILTITKETVQADKYKEIWNTSLDITEKVPVVNVISGTIGNLQPGDVVGIGETEDFFVLSSDNSPNGETVLLARYNLLVGNIVENYWQVVGSIDPSTPGYGLQSIDAKAYSDGGSFRGAIPFSDTAYWMNGDDLLSPYNENDTIYHDDDYKYRSDDSIAYPYVYDENSNIYQYISGENGYVNKLKDMGAPNTITGRLLTYEEVINNINVKYNDVSIVDNKTQSFWLGNAGSNSDFVFVYGYDSMNPDNLPSGGYDYDFYYGIRPVIEIQTSEIGK